MRTIKRITAIVFILALVCSLTPTSMSVAASKNNAAGKAFAKAIQNGKIKYSGKDGYVIADMDGDGVKDLFVARNNGLCKAFVYKNGKIKSIDIPSEYGCATYNKNMKAFLDCGEGDYAWISVYKIKNGKAVEKYTYESSYKIGNKKYYVRHYPSGKVKKITKKKFSTIWSRAMTVGKATKKKLINKLKNLK